MEQLSLFAVLPLFVDPLSLLRPDTGPEWLQDCLECWDDPDSLVDHLDNLKDDLRNVEQMPGKMLQSWHRTMIHDLKETIRVVGTRVRELQ